MKRVIFLILFLAGLSVQNVFAQDDIPGPKPGLSYPVGTTLKAVCKFADASHKESTWTNFQIWDESIGGYGGINTVFDPVVDPSTCTATFTTPGKYRMVVIRGRWGHDEGHEIVAEFTINGPSPCDSKSNQIIAIRDGNGKILSDEERKAIGLGENSFMSGQTVTVPKSIPKGIDIKFFDDSRLRISSGTKYKVNSCSDLNPIETSATVKLTLLLGKIWAEITPEAEMKYQIETERSVDGNRGTTFSTEYDPTTKTTKVVVEEGSVWLRNKFGKVETIIINEGETGTQTMDQPPVLKKN